MTKSVEEEENTEYESDDEDVKLLSLRRRVASDDELDDTEIRRNSSSQVVGFDVETDSEGAADEYYDNNDDDDDDDVDDDDDDEEEEEECGGDVEEREIGGEKAAQKAAENEDGFESKEVVKGEEEVKEVELAAVPTTGAFYMHDDRFRDRVDGKHRRTFGGRKLWESRDERKWGHDKFEEVNLQDRRRYEEGRRAARGAYRGRGKARGGGRGNGRGNGVRGFSRNSNQNDSPKDVRGRGPRRYQPLTENTGETHQPQYKQSSRSLDKSSRSSSGRMATSTGSSNVEYEAAPAKKAGSNLSSASLPFYPSGASTMDIPLTRKKVMNTGNHNRNFRPSVDPKYSTPVSNPLVRGKHDIASAGIENLHINDAVSPASSKDSLHLRYSASTSLSPNQLTRPRRQGRVMQPTKSDVVQPPQINNQVNKVSLKATQVYQRRPVQTQVQSPLQAPGQQLAQLPLVVSQSSSPPKAGLLTNKFVSKKSDTLIAQKGKGAVQGTERGSLVYGGTQVGSGDSVSAGHGDPNIPAFFPAMQFGGQHPSGMGVPAVGMAFPGYVGQPNGLGKSEMTWLPMLARAASAAGALGATYPPYLSVDGNYHPQPTGQTTTLHTPSKDNNFGTSNHEINSQQRSEIGNDQLSQRQSKPRRYSEMNFSQ